MAFLQNDFTYKDLYQDEGIFQLIIKHYVDKQYQSTISADLSQFSKRACGDLLSLIWRAESNPPQLIQYDHWGKRIDEIKVDPAWDSLHQVSAQEGIVAIGYERQCGEYSRLHQFLKLMFFHPSSAFYSCPLAMTDGAASVLEKSGGELKELFFAPLVSRDPLHFWTAGQWMTEKVGGSDVSQSETRAIKKGDKYYLYGSKWFTSAITANISMTLAQTDVDGQSRLSLFLVPIRDQSGQLNNIEVLRLKDKLGTKAMPTAELELKGVPAHLVGELGRGVKNITSILNISRLYNAVCATGTLLRLHSLAADYAHKRIAFGKKLIDHPLHAISLVKSKADSWGSILFVTELSLLLGKQETNRASAKEQALLRFFTPVIKLWTAKKAMTNVSELIECFGGAGYIEDTQLPRFLRDVQVFSIWEGTTNIMSLDTLRAIQKDQSAQYVFQFLNEQLQSLLDQKAQVDGCKTFQLALSTCQSWLENNLNSARDLEAGAREFSMTMGSLFVGIQLMKLAQQTKSQEALTLAQVFCDDFTQPKFSEYTNKMDALKNAIMA
jgi:alkylation response protein AidB-like acyl-CoA dehydrogenase